MARVSFSPLIVAASGKVKDTVFSKWKGRAYIRARVVPANPQSAAQTLVRESLARCVELWQSFQTKLKNYWDDYATPYSLSGYNTFMSANRADEQAASELLASPHNKSIDPADTFTAVSGTGSGEIDCAWTGGSVSAAHFAYIIVRKVNTNEFVMKSSASVLFSVGAETLTGLAAGIEHQVYLSNEDTTEELMSKSMSDTCDALA